MKMIGKAQGQPLVEEAEESPQSRRGCSAQLGFGWGLVPTPMMTLANSGTSLDFHNLTP
uniref:Uncharacterized protein n=1 Tax=Aegilops tauschii subsp. strangulata TaxID=200361 RepID=A0A453BTH3_AEGTS